MTDEATKNGAAGSKGSRVRRLVEGVERRVTGGRELHRKIDQLTRLVERVIATQKHDEKWRMIFRRQLNALIRHEYLDAAEVAHPDSLIGRRFRLRSQNEEDGIILALLKAVGVRTRRFVEIGCGSTGGNSAILAYDFGWSGLMVDAKEKAIARLRMELKGHSGSTVVRARVSSRTINELIERHGFSGEVDLLSIDIDSIDYWVLGALTACSPRVLVMEYNARFGPDRAVTLPNKALPADSPKGYSGASLSALAKAAEAKGYRLVLCEEAGVNAFFLRNDLAPQIRALTPAEAYRPLMNRYHVEDDRVRETEDIYQVIRERNLPLVDV